jgi:hypothetical protein
MNQTKTKAVSDKTLYEAVFGKKPNLSDVREWGEKLWVRVKKGDKLGGRVKEGKWMGVSDESKGMRVYWPDMKTVSTEQNIYFDKQSRQFLVMKGRNWILSKRNLTILQAHQPKSLKILPKLSMTLLISFLMKMKQLLSPKSPTNEFANPLSKLGKL